MAANALDIPLISIETLRALAVQVKQPEGLIIPMLDARRMEVYSAVFDTTYNKVRDTQAQILDDSSFMEYLNSGKVFFIGNGVSKTKDLIAHENAIYVEGRLPSANEMSALAFDKYKKNDIEDVAYFEPYYLKDFIALKPKA